MLSGFQLLETYLPDEKVDIEKFEKNFGFTLPPLYRLFVKTFRLGKKLKKEYYFDPKEQNKFAFNVPVYEPLKNDEEKYLEMYDFYSIDEVYEKWNEWGENENCNWTNYNFLDISSLSQGGNLCLGTNLDEIDVVYQVLWDFPHRPIKIADNIFEFIKGFTLREKATELYSNYLPSQLYKNYGEDFWRIRSSVLDQT